jgi:hypothetical protein
MYRLKLPLALCFVLPNGLASGAQSTANFGSGPFLETFVDPGSVVEWLPGLFSLPSHRLFSSGHKSKPAVLRIIDPSWFSKGTPAGMTDHSLSASGIASAPAAQPSPIQ